MQVVTPVAIRSSWKAYHHHLCSLYIHTLLVLLRCERTKCFVSSRYFSFLTINTRHIVKISVFTTMNILHASDFFTPCAHFLFRSHEHKRMIQISFSQPWTHNTCFKFVFHSHEHTTYDSNFFLTAMNTTYDYFVSQPWTHNICFIFISHSHKHNIWLIFFTAINTQHMLQIYFSQPWTHNIRFKFLFDIHEHTTHASYFFLTAMNTQPYD